jgi:hypothetical protein
VVAVRADVTAVSKSRAVIAALQANVTLVTVDASNGGWGHRSCLPPVTGDFVPWPPFTGARGDPLPVPELRLVNRGADPLLLVDGEELVGAKQNRIVNLTIMVAPQSHLTIPVSCVEAGRWRARSRAFSSAPRTQYATGRAKRMAQVSQSMAFGHYTSDQSEVWADIAEKSSRLNTSSPTGAMAALFADNTAFIDECAASLPAGDHQVGALFTIWCGGVLQTQQ